MKKLLAIFVLGFILNLIWENWHAFLYANYQGGAITEFILLRATLFDAIFISIICWPFIFYPKVKHAGFGVAIPGLILAVLIEKFALATGRWAYTDLMPIVPILNVGLTPAVQLGLLGFLSYTISSRWILPKI
ncbi:MAG: hypothetical protein WC250_02720 [Candidatus Paceibacterota bacterium]